MGLSTITQEIKRGVGTQRNEKVAAALLALSDEGAIQDSCSD